MTALNKINQTLSVTSNQLDQLSKDLKSNPHHVKPEKIEKLTEELARAATDVSQAKKSTGFKAEIVKSNLTLIGRLKRNETLNQEFKSVLKSFESQLKNLKNLKEESTSAPEVKVKPAIRRDPDVGKHLNDVNAKLKTVLSNKEKGNTQQFKELTNMLMKTNVALTKAVAFHNTLTTQYKPDYNARMIQTILNGINNLGNQAVIMQVSNQAALVNTFNLTLAEAKGLLEQVLDHLKESRGKRVAKVRSDRAKK